MIFNQKKAQATLEITVLIALTVAALLAMSIYLKRSMQGRLRSIADEIGEQYSPTNMDTNITVSVDSISTSETAVEKQNTIDGKVIVTGHTNDTSTRTGHEEVTGYEDEGLF